MTTARIPPVRVDPARRQATEQALDDDETLASLVEIAVRNEMAERPTQSGFDRRGISLKATATESRESHSNAACPTLVLTLT